MKPFTLVLHPLIPDPKIDVDNEPTEVAIRSLLPQIDVRPCDDAVTLVLGAWAKGDPGTKGNDGPPGTTTWAGIADKPAIPSKTSDLVNDVPFLTPTSIPSNIATTDEIATASAAASAALSAAVASLDTAIAAAQTTANNAATAAALAALAATVTAIQAVVGGLGTASTQPSTAFDAAGAAATVNGALTAHIDNTANPHATNAHQVDAYTQAEIIALDASILASAKADAAAEDAEFLATAKSYTDTADTAAIATAKAYTDTADTAAIATAEAYTDASIATVVGVDAGILTTLTAIAAEFASDESAAAALTTAVNTNAATAATATAAVATDLADHEADHGNPHQVTAAQVGAPTIAQCTADTAAALSSANATTAAAAAATLTTAEAYADTGDATTLAASKSYADGKVGALGSAATHAATDFDAAGAAATAQGNSLQKASNFSDVPNKVIAVSNLGLGSAAWLSSTQTLLAANNFSELFAGGNIATARANLGLGSAAIHAASDFDPAGSATAAQTAAETYTNAQVAALTPTSLGVVPIPTPTSADDGKLVQVVAGAYALVAVNPFMGPIGGWPAVGGG